MSEKVIYIDREDAKQVEEEELNIFIKGVLEELGLPLDEIWPDIYINTVNDKLKFRELLVKSEIDIINDGDRGCKIYFQNKLFAEWFKPRFILKTDHKALTNKKKLFYEMHIKTLSIFEK